MPEAHVKSAGPVAFVLHQHVEDGAFLWELRDKAVRDPHYSLADLSILDSRVEAHIDGLRAAGDAGWELCDVALQSGGLGELFVAAVLALEGTNDERLEKVLNAAARSPNLMRGFSSAVGWLQGKQFEKWLPALLEADSLASAQAAIAGLAIRRMEVSPEIDGVLQRSGADASARVLRAVGESKRRHQLTFVHRNIRSGDEACRFWSAWSSVLLGERIPAESLKSFVNFKTSFAGRAIGVIPRVLTLSDTQKWLRGLAQDESTTRYALIGCGVTGDPLYIPTLISQMNIPEHARVAGEAFSMITGVDLAYDDLDTDWPEGFEAGPTEDPADENVDLDPDEDLPWPNQELLQKWWNEHGRAFQPGVRYLCGQPISRENCRRVLIEGFQRQRIAAALELALLNPDEPLFEWRAPGWRQQEWLGLRKPRAPRS